VKLRSQVLLECLSRASATDAEGEKAFGAGCKDSAESKQGTPRGGMNLQHVEQTGEGLGGSHREGKERRAPDAGFYCEKMHGALRRVRAQAND
jgi:hypothetical protein